MAGTSAGVKKGWLKRQHAIAMFTPARVRIPKLTDIQRAAAMVLDLRKSFKALGIGAVPWHKGIRALARRRGAVEDAGLPKALNTGGLPRYKGWRPVPTASAATLQNNAKKMSSSQWATSSVYQREARGKRRGR
jgi:hypothetical protein